MLGDDRSCMCSEILAYFLFADTFITQGGGFSCFWATEAEELLKIVAYTNSVVIAEWSRFLCSHLNVVLQTGTDVYSCF